MKRIIFGILCLTFLTLIVKGQPTDAANKALADQIRNENVAGGNTKQRIADAFQSLNDGKVSIISGVNATGLNTYAATVGSTVVSYVNGQHFYVKIPTANSGASTINLGPGAKAIVIDGIGTPVPSGALKANRWYDLIYDASVGNFQTIGELASGSGSGTVNTGIANQLAYYATSTNAISGLAAITANRVLISDGSGLPIAATTTDTEIGFVSGVTSSIQTQFGTKQATLVSGTNIKTVNSNSLVGSGNVAVGDLLAANNLSEVTPSTARTNLGLGTAATQNSTAFEVPLTFSTGLTRTTNTITVNTSQNIAKLSNLTTNGFVKTGFSDGTLSVASLVSGDIPNNAANTTGSAATLTTPRSIYGNNFDGSSALSQIIASTFGGTGNGFTKFSGPATSEKTFTLPNASAAILTDNALVSVAQGGTGVNVSTGASSVVLRDASQNISVNNSSLAYATTATAAGTTTLTVSSARYLYFTGSNIQTVVLPVVSTLPATGFSFNIVNNSSLTITIQSSGGNSIQVMAANSVLEIRAILLTGTTGSSWAYNYYPSDPTTATGDIIYKNGTDLAKLAIGSTGDIFTPIGGVPSWSTGLPGVTTNSSAAAGKVGEYVSSSIAVGSATSLTTATAKNVTSISLTAGDWVVSGNVTFTESSATVTSRTAGISSTSATLPTDGSEIENGSLTTLISEKITLTIPPKSIKLSGTTTVYLIGSETFSAGTSSGYGAINAWRVR